MVHVIETMEAIPGKTEELKKALLEIVPLSREEKGCISYDLFQKQDNPHQFALIMHWKDRKSYDSHNSAIFIQKFMEDFDNVLYKNCAEALYQPLELSQKRRLGRD